MDRSLLIAAGAAGVLYLVESAGGPVSVLGNVRHGARTGAQGKALPTISSPGNQAAIASLAALGSVAGIPVTVDPDAPGMVSIWTAMQPQVTASTDGVALATAFLTAYDAARKADPQRYAQTNVNTNDASASISLGAANAAANSTPCSAFNADGTWKFNANVTLNSLGQAACALAAARDGYQPGGISQTDYGVAAAFGLDEFFSNPGSNSVTDPISTLCSEMDNVGYTNEQNDTSLVTNQEAVSDALAKGQSALSNGIQWSLVTGGHLIGTMLGDVLGSAADGLLSTVLSSDLVWAVGFGFLAWKVLR